MTPEATAAVEAIVKDNRRVTVHEIAAHLDMSVGSAHHIGHDVLQFHKVSARWVPRRIERTTCWCLPGTFKTIWSRWWLPRKNCYGRWNLGPLPPARNQESEQGMTPYLLTKSEKILRTTMCGKSYADSLLGWTRGDFGALHAQGEHCDWCNICRC